MARRRRIPRDSTLVLDGYNVLFAGRGLVPGLASPESDLASAREALVQLVAGYQQQRSGKAWVVFDARAAVLADRELASARVRVTFAVPPRTADDEIVGLVCRLDLGRKLLVVTTDRELQARVSAEKAETLSSRAFLRVVAEAIRRSQPPGPPDMTTDQWLRYFGCDTEQAPGC